MKLLIVESPGKIKKIKSILGDSWQVAASVGHIRDLPSDSLGIDKSNRFKMLYVENPDKKSVIFSLKKHIRECGPDNVYLATDEDREGEAISFHLCQVLGLDYKTTKRVTFNEISKKAVLDSIAKPRKINLNLVAAQESRRALDRLVGFQISPILWRKLSLENKKALSAGRVQSVALRMVVEREHTINGFTHSLTPILNASFKTPKGSVIRASYLGESLSLSNPKGFMAGVFHNKYAISELKKSPLNKSPLPPFSTSTLQQDASRKLKVSVDKVMKMAQKLYEDGFITYMRTDSVNISSDAMAQAKTVITDTYGEDYFKERIFDNKNQNAQEAHEAIRPSDFSIRETGDENDKLYQLIRSRALASQMAEMQMQKTEIFITAGDHRFKASSTLITFDGFSLAYSNIEEEQEQEQPLKEDLSVGNPMECLSMELTQKVGGPPKRYDQAGLVKELEQKGIGRPATYASIISNIVSREYIMEDDAPGKQVAFKSYLYHGEGFEESMKKVTIGSDKRRLMPTPVGTALSSFLCTNFPNLLDYQFTLEMEGKLDSIAQGEESFALFVSDFDKGLQVEIEKIEASLEDKKVEGERMVPYNGQQIKASKGKFGYYLLYDQVYYNLKEDYAKLSDEEIKLLLQQCIKEKLSRKQEADKLQLKTIGKYQIRNGKYGIYLTDGKTFAGIPEGKNYENLSEAECKEILIKHKEKKKSDKNRK